MSGAIAHGVEGWELTSYRYDEVRGLGHFRYRRRTSKGVETASSIKFQPTTEEHVNPSCGKPEAHARGVCNWPHPRDTSGDDKRRN